MDALFCDIFREDSLFAAIDVVLQHRKSFEIIREAQG
jgi:hypothetical protein